MSKTGYYRGDIYRADLKNVDIDIEHYVVLISNWKALVKSSRVTVVVISSQEKEFNKTHIELEANEYGLDKKSYIQAENIHTISKSDLKYKVGKLDGSKLLELDNKLKLNLQLDDKYTYLNDIDLEDLFLENNTEIIREREELTQIKCEMYDLCEKKTQYETAIIRSYELIDKINKSKQVNKNEFLYYAYHIQAKSYIKLKNFDKALECAKMSLTYMARPSDFNRSYSFALWTIARAYEEIDEKKDKASAIYNSLSNYYKTNGYEILSLSCRFNVAKLNKNIKRMVEIQNELKNLDIIEKMFSDDNYKQKILKEMNEDINALKCI